MIANISAYVEEGDANVREKTAITVKRISVFSKNACRFFKYLLIKNQDPIERLKLLGRAFYRSTGMLIALKNLRLYVFYLFDICK